MKRKYNNIRTGVIGVGSMGQNHARIYKEISNLVGVSDLDEEQGKIVSERLNVTYFPDFQDMLKQVDAVSIAVPTSLHLKIVEIVSERNVHALIEKPLSNSLSSAKLIHSISSRSDKVFAVGHIERHNPVIKYAKNAINSGEWGKLLTISAKRFSHFPERIKDVGVIHDLSIHDIDILRYLVNSSVENIRAIGGRHNQSSKYEDFVHISMSFGNGVIGMCETNWLTHIKVRDVHLTTDERYIILDLLNQSIKIGTSSYTKINKANLFETNIGFDVSELKVERNEPLMNELVDFLEAINMGTLPLVTVEDGLRAVEIAEICSRQVNETFGD